MALALFVGAAAISSAQETTGTIAGSVSDQTGAMLPGVTVNVKNVQTGRTWDFVSTETGTYTASLLPPGTYEVTFSLQGFQPTVIKAVELHVNDRLKIDGKMGITGVAESVEVSAASTFVQPTAQVQSLMGPQQVQELPLNNRNFVQLATLVPGVSSDLSDEVGIGLTSTVSISINGARRNSVNWLVDGVSNVDVGSNITLLSTPTLESIQEFKVITSSYQAEWPRSGGGVVNVVTKSGGNRFSGVAYEFWRNDKLNANSYFRNLSSDPMVNSRAPRLRYNNFGYTMGGPILKDKTFFFFSEEWRRVTRAPASTTATVPLASWLTDPTNPNYVPPALRDPNALKLLALWPAPNQEGTQSYLTTFPSINNTRQEVLRVDHDFNGNWRLTARYTHDLSQTREPQGLFGGSPYIASLTSTNTDVPGNVFASEVRTIMGRGLNELKYQLSGNKITSNATDGTTNTRAQVGIQIPELFGENQMDRIPSIAVSGLTGWTINQFFDIQYWNHSVTDNFTFQRDNHTYKAGFLATFEQKNEGANNNTQGSFSFGTTQGGRTAFQNFLTGNRDGLCGATCTYTEAEVNVTNHLRWKRYEMFVQDTWRIRPNVTLDYGLRYGLYPSIIDANNTLDTFDPSRYDPAQAPTFANASGSLINVGSGNPTNGIIVAGQSSPYGRGIYKTEKTDFQPRIGMSWDPKSDGKTIYRSAFGVYYDQPLVGIFEQNAFTNPPFVNTVSLQNASLSNPASGTSPTTTGVRNLIATTPNFKTPRYMQWNVGMQRQLYRRGVLDVSYVGSRGDRLLQPVDINLPQPQDVVLLNSINRARPYIGYGTINMRQTTARSRFWGLLTAFRHEAGLAGTLTVNYTLSRNRATASNDRDGVDLPQNPLDLDAEYADARTDRRHIFSATYVYELPFFRNSTSQLAKSVLGGWQISGITTISSGPPIPLVSVSNNSNRRGNRADRVGDPKAGNMPWPYWFDPTAFVPPADGTYGNSGRAPFRQPGRHQWDITLSKNWYPTGGDTRVQFRADFVNAFNHTQYVGDATASQIDNSCTVSVTNCLISTDRFGQILGTRAPREIQLGLKIYW